MKKFVLVLATVLLFTCGLTYAAGANKKSIEINIPSRTLYLYDGGELVKGYPVCVGKSSAPTDTGSFKVIYKAVDPYWLNDGKVVPPGPENPLGTRWIGILQDVGIHGNNSPDSIGTYTSGGCIRMYNKDVEELYSAVPVNTPVTIKYDRMELFDDKYSCRKAVILYPDIYNAKDSSACLQEIKNAGSDEAIIKKSESELGEKYSRAIAVCEGTGVFLNDRFITCDASYTDGSLYLNSQAALEVFGLSADFVREYKIPLQEKDGKIYINLSKALEELKGKLEYDSKTRNAYASLNILKVNGVYLTSSCGNFDKEYYIDVQSVKKLGYGTAEDKVELKLFGKNIVKIIRDGTPCVSLDSLLKVCGTGKYVNSLYGTIDVEMPTILKYGDMAIRAETIDGRLYIKKDSADGLAGKGDITDNVITYKNTDYVDAAVFLEEYSYKTNQYCTVIELEKQEL